MKVVILGGTGTLGSSLARRLSANHDVLIVSRDELKQQELKRRLPGVKFMLGDIRDKEAMAAALDGARVVFHVAALKHVDVLEDNVGEAIKTNVLGTAVVAEAAIAAGVDHVVFSSTDKAVLPINAYGMSKAMAERHLFALNKRQSQTKFAVYRWGNVLGSRGSVLHQFAKTLREHSTVYITDVNMTRFWLHIEDAVTFMLDTYRQAPRNKALIPPMKASKVVSLAHAVAEVTKCMPYKIEFVGVRPGEKLHECVDSTHDYCTRSDNSPFYAPEELRALVERSLGC